MSYSDLSHMCMNAQCLRRPEFTNQYFWRKSGLCYILRTTNATKLTLSLESPLHLANYISRFLTLWTKFMTHSINIMKISSKLLLHTN